MSSKQIPLRKRPDVQFCAFCGSSEKLGYEGFRLKCYVCGKLFEVKEIITLQEWNQLRGIPPIPSSDSI